MLLGLFTWQGSGCSFIFAVRPKNAGDRLSAGDCALNYVPPALDTMWAGLQGLTLGTALRASSTDWGRRHESSRSATIMTSALQIAVFGASAAFGYYRAARCVSAQQEVEVAAK